jgi:nickel-dependent lactate racemase
MTAGEATCKKGGVIIMVAACNDGHGGESFMKTMTQDLPPAQILSQIQSTPKQNTVPDQWESQILARILSKFQVVLVSECAPELVKAMKMHPAGNLTEALALAENLLGRTGSVTAIPEGISTIIV